MLTAQLHGPKDLRIAHLPHPGPPGPGQILLRVTATGICGSDLHTYQDGRIGDTQLQAPLVLGHEFGGVVEVVGPGEGLDGNFAPLKPGLRVAVDPAQPCGRCEMCEQGHPNLCHRLHFCGLYPDGGSLCEWMHVPAHTCFPVPDAISDVGAALLEPLGVALHATDLAHLRVAESVVILGAGPIGLLILQTVRLSGATPIYAVDQFDWRLDVAAELGAIPVNFRHTDPVQAILDATHGRGVDVVIEAAWAGEAVQQAAEMVRLGGRLVLVGIPGDNALHLTHSTFRRKGITLRMARRMKHVYPRAIRLAQVGLVQLDRLVSHRFALAQTDQAFALNDRYAEGVVKVMIGRAD